MRALIAAFALLAVPCAWAEDQAATQTPVEAVDEREAALRELEYRLGMLSQGRAEMRAAIPGLPEHLRVMSCKAANTTMSDPAAFKSFRKKVAFLDKPKNFSQLSPAQVERLTSVRARIDEMEREPGIDCAKF